MRRVGRNTLNATDTAATLDVAYFSLHLAGMETLGLRYSTAEKEAMAHMWRWIGHAMGVAPDLQPLSSRFATQMQDTFSAFDQRTDGASAATLTSALLRQGLPPVFGITSRVNDVARLTLPTRAVPLAGRAHNLLRATGLLGDDTARAGHAESMVGRLLARADLAEAALLPEAAVRESQTNRSTAA